MSKRNWVVYDKQTGRKVRVWKQEARASKHAASEAGLAYSEESFYNTHIGNQTRTVKSLMSGQDVEIGVNTPLCCDPSSETYWSC